MSGRWLIYGANGYTGALCAARAKAAGLEPILAGRRAEAVAAVAERFGFETRVFALEESEALRAGLAGVDCVLHVAGPFSATSAPMLEACLATRTHYLDVTGEIDVFEHARSVDARAREAGIVVLPGVGFDVVPSDCLAAHVARGVEHPIALRIAIRSAARPSRGTAKTTIESADQGTRVRRGGALRTLPTGSLTRRFDFGRGPETCSALAWGDVSTAYHSTAIPDVEVYFALPPLGRAALRFSRLAGPVLTARPVQRFLKARIDALPPGPDAEARGRARTTFLVEIDARDGETQRARLDVGDGYDLTAEASVDIASRAAAGELPVGFQTPSTALGPDYVLGLTGVTREG